MQEIIVNLHMHTLYSDGHATHAELAQTAIQANLDAIIVTDHNVWVNGVEGYFEESGKRVMLLVGEEIHDPARQPQKNHLLVIGAGRELAGYAPHPQRLLDQVRQTGGLAFIAHPIDPALPAFGEGDISWVDWNVRGFTGIELWNAFSEFKAVVKNKPQGLYYAFNPHRIAHGPLPETLALWDRLLATGRRVVAVGGSDAHALPKRLGPLRKTIFPYAFHFKGVNTHLMLPQALTGDFAQDRQMLLDALRDGHAFIGMDQQINTRGFRFTAHGKEDTAGMGDEIPARGGVTLQVRLPHSAECRLIKDGSLLKGWRNRDNIVQIATEPGVYRVEAYLHTRLGRRGWIFSNPIYIRE